MLKVEPRPASCSVSSSHKIFLNDSGEALLTKRVKYNLSSGDINSVVWMLWGDPHILKRGWKCSEKNFLILFPVKCICWKER